MQDGLSSCRELKGVDMTEYEKILRGLFPAEKPVEPANVWDPVSPAQREIARLLAERQIAPPSSSSPIADRLASLLNDFPTTTRLPIASSPPAPFVAPAPEIRRKVYFAFDFDDLMRVNNVRQVGKVGPRVARSRGFFDRSIWESRSIKNIDNLKKLMRGAIQYSSAICVLIGTHTWHSRWVRYEIARAVIDDKGLLAVHVNGINHHERKEPDKFGVNPLHFMGLYHSPNGNYYLCERQLVVHSGEPTFEWQFYADYSDPVQLPRYMGSSAQEQIIPLSHYAAEYDMVRDNGYANMGGWFDSAALAVGR